jgi:hypothetical protein
VLGTPLDHLFVSNGLDNFHLPHRRIQLRGGTFTASETAFSNHLTHYNKCTFGAKVKTSKHSFWVLIYSEFFLRLAIGFYMLIFQPPVNFCSDENIQTIFGRKLEDLLNCRIDYNSISQTVKKVVKKIFLARRKRPKLEIVRCWLS